MCKAFLCVDTPHPVEPHGTPVGYTDTTCSGSNMQDMATELVVSNWQTTCAMAAIRECWKALPWLCSGFRASHNLAVCVGNEWWTGFERVEDWHKAVKHRVHWWWVLRRLPHPACVGNEWWIGFERVEDWHKAVKRRVNWWWPMSALFSPWFGRILRGVNGAGFLPLARAYAAASGCRHGSQRCGDASPGRWGGGGHSG
eukprot:6189163-Pyramimonas_sp.AAC.2